MRNTPLKAFASPIKQKVGGHGVLAPGTKAHEEAVKREVIRRHKEKMVPVSKLPKSKKKHNWDE